MDMNSGGSFIPGDPHLVDHIVNELKSQGIFDQFRKECIADVDTKPAYQNLRQRVEGSVAGFLSKQTWKPDLNKNQLRETLRKNIHESGFLEIGVERIVDQVVNPKIRSVFLPQVEDVVYKYLGIEKPAKSSAEKLEPVDLLPEDLEAVSPESDVLEKEDETDNAVVADSKNEISDIKNEEKVEEEFEEVEEEEEDDRLDDSKEDFESPAFEPIHPISNITVQHENDENSIDSRASVISDLMNQDSNIPSPKKLHPLAVENTNQESHMSIASSSSRLSIVTDKTSPDDTKMDVEEDSAAAPSSIVGDKVQISDEVVSNENSNNVEMKVNLETQEVVPDNISTNVVPCKIENELMAMHSGSNSIDEIKSEETVSRSSLIDEKTALDLKPDLSKEETSQNDTDFKLESMLATDNEESFEEKLQLPVENEENVKTDDTDKLEKDLEDKSDSKLENKKHDDKSSSKSDEKSHRKHEDRSDKKSDDKDKKPDKDRKRDRHQDDKSRRHDRSRKDSDRRHSHSESSKDRKDEKDRKSEKDRKDGHDKKEKDRHTSSSSKDYKERSKDESRYKDDKNKSDLKPKDSKDSKDKSKSSHGSKSSSNSSASKEKSSSSKSHHRSYHSHHSSSKKEHTSSASSSKPSSSSKSSKEKPKEEHKSNESKSKITSESKEGVADSSKTKTGSNTDEKSKVGSRDEVKGKSEKDKHSSRDDSKKDYHRTSSSSSSHKEKRTSSHEHKSRHSKDKKDEKSDSKGKDQQSTKSEMSSEAQSTDDQQKSHNRKNDRTQSGSENVAQSEPAASSPIMSPDIVTNVSELPTVRLKKPKIASNILEVRRLIKVRKKLEKIERKRLRQLHLAQQSQSTADIPTDSPVEDTISLSSVHAKETTANSESTDDQSGGDGNGSPSNTDEITLPSAIVSKESWDAIEAKLNQSDALKIDYESYKDYESAAEKSDRKSDDEDCLYLNPKASPATESNYRYLKRISSLQKLDPSSSQLSEVLASSFYGDNSPAQSRSGRSRKPNSKYCSEEFESELDPKKAALHHEEDDEMEQEVKESGRTTAKRKASVMEPTNEGEIETESKKIHLEDVEEEEPKKLKLDKKPLSPAGTVDATPKAKITKGKKTKKDVLATETTTSSPRTPESDISSKSETKTKQKAAEEKELLSKSNRKAPTATQRYSSDDLYKPRPQYTSSSRRRAALASQGDTPGEPTSKRR